MTYSNQSTLSKLMGSGPNTVFRNSNPLDFDLYNDDQEQVLYIQDDPSAQRMHLEIHNTSQWAIEIAAPALATSGAADQNYHFALRFRHGTLISQTQPKLTAMAVNESALSADQHQLWSMTRQQLSNDTVSFNILSNGTLTLGPGERLKLTLDGLIADGRGGARNTRVELSYQRLHYVGDPTPINGARIHHLSIANRYGRKSIPLHVSVIGSNTILNDGASANEQTLRITNALSDDSIPLVPTGDAASKFILAFDVFNANEMNDWALGNADAVAKIVPRVLTTKKDQKGNPLPNEAWKVTKELQGESPEWIIQPVNKTSLAAGESVLLQLSNIISSLPSGPANVYVRYENIPGYWDGQFIVSLEKTALVQRDKFIGIGSTNDPAAMADRFTDVFLDVHGRANVWSGERYAVPQGFMAPGSLTIGNLGASFGGSTNCWNSNTAGLLLETQANTEIAVHNKGKRVASLMYYEGGDSNRVTIGRNMGWGPLSVVSINGNVGIGTSNPGLNQLAIQQKLGSDDYGKYQHQLQFEIRSGLGTRSMGIGLLDNGKGLLQVKEASIGYNDLLLNPVAGNVGIGTGSPDRKLTIQSGDGGTYLNVKSLGYEVLLGVDSSGGILSTMTNHDLQLRAGGNQTKLTVKADGDVCIGPLGPMARLTVDTQGGPGNSIFCEHHGSNFIVAPLSAGSNSTVIANSGGGGLYLRSNFVALPNWITIGDWTIEARQEQAWGQQVSALYILRNGKTIARFGDIQDMLQIHQISNPGHYFFCNDQGNTGWAG